MKETAMLFISLCALTMAARHGRVKRGWISGTRPPGTKCAFNPCSIDNFCGEGRTCELDSRCVHHCKCDDNFTHDSCITSDASVSATQVTSTTSAPRTCAFDVCKHAFTCSGNRKCVLDAFCMPKCECVEESTHELCATSNKETTADPREEVDDVCSLVCAHGDCVIQDLVSTCKCDEGWTGNGCEIKTCNLTCKDGFYCSTLDNGTETCESLTEQSTEATTSVTPDIILKRDACSSDYKLRNLTCQNGLPCKYGYCEVDDAGITRCQCDFGSRGPLCNSLCCRFCGNGECNIHPELGEICNCHVNYTGANCTEPVPEELPVIQLLQPTWYLWVVGGSVFVLVLLLLSLVLVPYLLWRHRVILIMKIVHYFQDYEDQDERHWDAFVSYRANDEDEKFVVHTLLPELEKRRGFHLNVHFRDFVPGDAIANNIINAVQGSRRTILIISPDFVQSEFTRYEYEKAREEMLTRKHRIIPILLKDIKHMKGDMDQTLKDILSSVTYIEWPHCGTQKKVDKFWKRLELSMPKKKQHPVPNEGQCQEVNEGQCHEVDMNDVAVDLNKHQPHDDYYDIPLDRDNVERDPEYDTINDVIVT